MIICYLKIIGFWGVVATPFFRPDGLFSAWTPESGLDSLHGLGWALVGSAAVAVWTTVGSAAVILGMEQLEKKISRSEDLPTGRFLFSSSRREKNK